MKGLRISLVVLALIPFHAHAKDERYPAGKVFKDCADCPEMVVVPAGSYDMGSNSGEKNEKPVHRVTIKRAFAIGKTEVTQGQWKAIMGNNPSKFGNCGDSCPVEQVSWDDVQAFIEALNTKTGKKYRLPSEAEWEYACRAGAQNAYCGSDNLDSVGWFGGLATPAGNSGQTTNPVATKQPNAWGLYDMSGNVWEWVQDEYHASYDGAPADGSAWEGEEATMRVPRGGGWGYAQRAAKRGGSESDYRFGAIGFRLARMLP